MLRVRTISTGVAGAPWYTNVYFEGSEASRAQDAVTSMGLFWTAIRILIHPSITMAVQADVPNIDPVTGDTLAYYSAVPQTITGNADGELLPPASQALVRLATSAVVANRRLKGRIFVPGFTEANSQNGNLSAFALGIIGPAAQEFATRASIRPVVWSRPAPDASPARTGDSAPTTGATVWNQFAVLRSRRD
jgi:hypothetical protein